MKRKISRILAIMMAFMVVVTSTAPVNVFAAQVDDSTVNAENTVSENGQDTVQALEIADEEIISENDTDTFGEKGKLNFLYLGNKYIESPGEQNVLVGYGDDETVLTSAKLEVQNYRTKEISSYYSEETMDNTVLFNMGFSPEEAGIYEITGVSFVTEDGEEKHISLSETGMAKVYFGVDEEVMETGDITAEPDASVEMQIVTFDEEGVSDVETEEITAAVEDALNEARNNVNAAPKRSLSRSAVPALASEADANGRSANGDIVVVLDPGHDATHKGASASGLNEEALTLKIAQYCKEELEQYSGVKVYMTRTSASCPYPGTSSTDDNKRRVDYARSVGADIYVSIHLNSSTSAGAHGAEVFYPNSNYNGSIGSHGANLATQISRQLAALGLNNRGITIRNSEDKTTYPDGSLADYYGVIRNSKLAGFPAVIVEHAFLTNASDAAFLSSEANLKKLGIADATGIANYLGVSKTINIKSNAPVIQNMNNSAGTFTASVTGVTPVSSVSSIRFAVWSTANGQDDLKWYTAVNAGNGTFTANINISNHGSEAGVYNVHAYAYDNKGGSHFLGATGCTFAKVPMSISSMNTSISNDGKTVTITVAGVLGVRTMRFAVWSAVNGQDDLIWYTAKDNGNGTWTAVVPISAHKGSAGTYYVHAYGENIYTANQFLKNTTFVVEGPKAGTVKILDANSGTGTFTVRVEGSSAISGIGSIRVAVWSKADQSNLVWYTATKKGDGIYEVPVDISKHGYQYGVYTVHAYVTDNNGLTAIAGATCDMKQPVAVVTATGNGNQTQFNIKASNVGYAGGVKGVRFAVWSTAGGQDDLVWYTGTNNGGGVWSANVKVANHKTAGTYNVHMYITDQKGSTHLGGSATFTVEGPKAGTVKTSNVDSSAGTFTVRVEGSSAISGIGNIRVAVWSKADQSNLVWYTATKKADGVYEVPVDISKHGYQYGVYTVHAYVTDNNGLTAIAGTTCNIQQPVAVVTATGNGNQTQFNIKASNVGYAGGVKGVRFAVWSTAGGQDDLVWYTGTNNGGGVWSTNVKVANHKTAGTYNVHMYITDQKGSAHVVGSTTFTVEGPKAGTAKTSNVDSGAGTFTVRVEGSSAIAGIGTVKLAVWSKADQSNLVWYTATKKGDGIYETSIDISKHGYQYGVYTVHAYVTDNNGVAAIAGTTCNIQQPVAVVTATGNGNQTQFNIKASNVGYAGGVKGVRFAVWSTAGGQDDLVWYTGTNNGGGVWSTNVKVANHKTAGTYNVHMYITDQKGSTHLGGSATFMVEGPKAGSVTVINKNESDGTFGVNVPGVSSVSGIKNVRVAVWCASNRSDIKWYTATKQNDGSYRVGVDVRNHQNNTGTYQAHVYVMDNNQIEKLVGATTCSIINVTNVLHPIMGSTSVTVEQMVAYYNSVTSYPAYYAGTEAPTIRQFCQIYVNECNAEGVKAEVAFVQAMKETNFLRFGGDVNINQFNFAGLGATGNGAPGNSFPSVTIGIRAQIQHLKAYASNEALNQACVDPRFQYVARNTAPYCEWLGINENPYGKGWATAVNYGYDVVNRANKLKTY